MARELPFVVIVGRSNVGKSTLFNAVSEQKKALVLPEAGTTRDRLESQVMWRKKQFTLVDTGGLDPSKQDIYHDPIIAQASQAQSQAALILFMVDADIGPLPQDQQIIKSLRKLGKPIILVINKCDNAKKRKLANAFARFKLDTQKISAINGSGIGDLLDKITELIKDADVEHIKSDITLALIGKPNVGKSSLLNSMLGKERMIVSETPHTTRDSQDVVIEYKDTAFDVIDTAGIRRKTKHGNEVEHLSINKSIAAINRSDVVALVMDISEKLTSQDHRLAREIEDTNKGLFIVANKWDKIPEKDEKTINKYTDYIASSFPNLSWVPIIFTSAQDNKRTKEILTLASDVKKNLSREITDNALSKFLKASIKKRKPTIGKGTRRPRLLSLKQTATNPPSFILDIPNKTKLALSYKQYLTNSLREKFDFEGVPIKLVVKERELKKDEMNIEKPKKKRMTHRSRRIPRKNPKR
ncbi:MAG: ribosome biogenesis GTPase Der [Patescibacteria group bacterium]|jgi:GTP-binding protein|nr:ribosome biogenesis GTPase Der [Patescibacteria group bacterium]